MADDPTGNPNPEPTVPKHRFDELNERMKAAEKQAREAQNRLEEIEEERQKQAGEYQKIAEKAQNEAAKVKEELESVRGAYLKERRLNTFRSAAEGIIRPDAIDDAFSMLSPDEMDKLEDSDTEGFKALAQNTADAKPYLQDAPRGAGSRGRFEPALASSGRQNGDKATKKPLPFGQNRRRFK